MTTDRTMNHAPPFWSALVFSLLACTLAVSGSLMRPVWHDELYTLLLARMPLTDLVAALRVDSGPPLHYLICHALFLIVGWAEGSALGTFMVRLPSVMAFTLMPWVLWRWARGRREVFFWAALLTIVWLPMLYFATEARAYALLALVNAVLWLLGPDLVRSGGRRLVLFAALAAALPMLHYAGIVSFCFLPALALFIPRSRWRSFAAALGAAVLPLLMWSPVILGAPNDSMRWVDTTSGPGHPGLATIHVLGPAGPFPALFEAPDALVPSAISMAAFLVMIVGCVVSAARLDLGEGEISTRLPNFTQTALGLAPLGVLATLAVCGLPVYFAGRTESMVWLLGVSLIAAPVVLLPRSWTLLAFGPYAAIGVCTIAMWLMEVPDRPLPPGVEVGRVLAREIRRGDVVVVAGLWQLEVEHGLAMARLDTSGGVPVSNRVRTIPRSQSEHPGWLDSAAAMSPAVFDEARVLEVEARRLGSRIWLVWSPALPVENTVFPAFSGWRRSRIAGSPIVAVDLLSPPLAKGGRD
jgi:hypothetical protein